MLSMTHHVHILFSSGKTFDLEMGEVDAANFIVKLNEAKKSGNMYVGLSNNTLVLNPKHVSAVFVRAKED